MPVKQKNKICLISTEVDDQGVKRISRYFTTKSKGKPASSNTKLALKKLHKVLGRYTLHTETKIKWK